MIFQLFNKLFEYLQKDEFKVLTAVETGMHNHEWVPMKVIERIAKLRSASAYKVIQLLLKYKLVSHTGKGMDAYKLQNIGYDFLALRVFRKSGAVKTIEMRIGVGKESDIYLCRSEDSKLVIMKLSRLGRTSFRTVKNNRDYIQGRSHYNWLLLSKLATTREFIYMQACYEKGFPVPIPVIQNRHGMIMSFINGFPL